MSTTTSITSRSYFDHQNADTSVSDIGDQFANNRSSVISRNNAMQKRSHREVRFGAYILGSTLGEGEFGKVKLGWRKDGKHPSQVAIKLIKRDTIVKDLESEIKIFREINSLRLLNHPNIVNLVEVLKSGKYIGIVLEYASGGELFDFILKQKYLKENVAKKLFAQLVSGVDYMHSKGLIHRDLKLENLLLDKHKNIVISDFGFVNSYNKSKNDLMKTSCGSPCYAAPELVLTQSPYAGRKVDIWSIGVILYAMLAGYLPFDDDAENEDGADIVKLYNYICSNPLTFPEYISPLARDLLRKIIVPNPAKRISMDEIRNHPWLAPHANLLSIRQVEWDRIVTEDKEKRSVLHLVSSNKQKRSSMFNETTNSSALMYNSAKTPHGRSYTSNSNVIYANPTTLSSLANVVALPNEIILGISSTSVSPNSPAQVPSGGGQREEVSPTRSVQLSFTRGHTKSTSMSGAYPSSASIALKAIVSEHDKPVEAEQQVSSATLSRGDLTRVSTYAGTIPTIAESPTQTKVEPNANTQAKNLMPAVERLPHGQRRPRPTSYHPGSISSSLSVVSANSPAVLDYMKMSPPLNLSVPQFLSSSPTKSLHRVESGATFSEAQSSPGSLSTLPTRKTTRRDSVVTPIHVNGVLSSDSNQQENKRNSVLSYLEDKMDTLELTELHSPIRSPVEDWATSKVPELPKLEVPLLAHETLGMGLLSNTTAPSASPIAELLKLSDTSSTKIGPERAVNGNEQVESKQSHVIERKDRDKENKEVRKNKKKNRFSILSFYSTSNASSNTISSSVKKALEPSNEANLPVPSSHRDQKTTESSSSGNATLTKRTSTSNSSANTSTFVNGREASAARKVMNFFKRKSVRIG